MQKFSVTRNVISGLWALLGRYLKSISVYQIVIESLINALCTCQTWDQLQCSVVFHYYFYYYPMSGRCIHVHVYVYCIP